MLRTPPHTSPFGCPYSSDRDVAANLFWFRIAAAACLSMRCAPHMQLSTASLYARICATGFTAACCCTANVLRVVSFACVGLLHVCLLLLHGWCGLIPEGLLLTPSAALRGQLQAWSGAENFQESLDELGRKSTSVLLRRCKSVSRRPASRYAVSRCSGLRSS